MDQSTTVWLPFLFLDMETVKFRVPLGGQTAETYPIEPFFRIKEVRLAMRIVPALLVGDLKVTLAFYAKLGFQLSGRDRDEGIATWAEVRRDGAVLQFHTEPPRGTPRTPVFSGTLYFFPKDVRALARELEGKIVFAWGPEAMPYGQLEFGIEDPNGYFLAFAEPA